MLWFGTSKAETFTAVPLTPINGFPHDQVVGAEVFIFPIGRTVFIDRLIAEMIKNSTGYWYRLKIGHGIFIRFAKIEFTRPVVVIFIGTTIFPAISAAYQERQETIEDVLLDIDRENA